MTGTCFTVVYVQRGCIDTVQTFPTLAEAERFWLEQCQEWDTEEDDFGIFDETGRIHKRPSDAPERLCQNCKGAILGEPFYTVNDKRLCRDCWANETFCCPECNEDLLYEDGRLMDGRTYCNECADKKETPCE